jgi:hypothetical protein
MYVSAAQTAPPAMKAKKASQCGREYR